jgi:hypothetical protein
MILNNFELKQTAHTICVSKDSAKMQGALK